MSEYPTSNKTRHALIEAAGQLAAEKGFNAISTRAIAQLSGENIGSIHYHFGSKEKLFEAVVLSVATRWLENPLEKVLADCDTTSAAGQAEAIRRIVTRQAALIFDKEIPVWHCRAIFQVMQYPNPLQETFRSVVLDLENELVRNLLKTIDPDMDDETAQLHFLLLLTPLFFHADYQSSILHQLGQNEYNRQYLQRLVDTSITQALLLFNLPLCRNEISHDSE